MRYEDAKPIYVTRYGCHAYGLTTPASDLDLRGIFVVLVRRGDREELLAIRERGIWSYDELVDWAERKDAELDELMASESCPLPAHPDRAMLDAACVEIVEEAWRQ